LIFSDNKIIDLQTSSVWNYDGIAISGELEGLELNRLPFNPGFWFEWIAFHPDTEVFEKILNLTIKSRLENSKALKTWSLIPPIKKSNFCWNFNYGDISYSSCAYYSCFRPLRLH